MPYVETVFYAPDITKHSEFYVAKSGYEVKKKLNCKKYLAPSEQSFRY